MSACDCSCDLYDGPYNQLEVETWHTARKEWVCCECGETITKDAKYQLWSLLNDGSWSKERTCAPCARIRSDLCSCWVFGELRESIWECLGFDYISGEDRDDDRR